jgi:hypothetical protein
VEREERCTAKKLKDRRDGESAPSNVWRQQKKSGSTKEADAEKKSTGNERNENRKKRRQNYKEIEIALGSANRTNDPYHCVIIKIMTSLNAMQMCSFGMHLLYFGMEPGHRFLQTIN